LGAERKKKKKKSILNRRYISTQFAFVWHLGHGRAALIDAAAGSIANLHGKRASPQGS